MGSSETKLNFNNLLIDFDSKICFIDEKLIDLSKSEYDILLYLMQNRNKFFNRNELLTALNKSGKLRSIDTLISRLRSKLGNYSKYIVSKSGFGYGFIENL